MAALCDIYVMDAFARRTAPRRARTRRQVRAGGVRGPLLTNELEALEKALSSRSAARAIVAGSKVSPS